MAVLVLAYVAFLYCLGRENTCHRSFTFRKSNENPLRRYYQFFVEITILAENLFMFSSPLGFQDTRGERHTIAIFVLKKKIANEALHSERVQKIPFVQTPLLFVKITIWIENFIYVFFAIMLPEHWRATPLQIF